jgi:hypothetical protein
MTWLGWLANVLLCYQWWAIGHKHQHGLLIGCLAGLLWAFVAVQRGMADLLFIELVLTGLQLRAWFLWRSKDGTSVPAGSAVHPGTSVGE